MCPRLKYVKRLFNYDGDRFVRDKKGFECSWVDSNDGCRPLLSVLQLFNIPLTECVWTS